MTGLWERQMGHTRDHLWHRQSATINQVIMATLKLSKWCHPLSLWLFVQRLLWSHQSSTSKYILMCNTSSRISYQARGIYSICRCGWVVDLFRLSYIDCSGVWLVEPWGHQSQIIGGGGGIGVTIYHRCLSHYHTYLSVEEIMLAKVGFFSINFRIHILSMSRVDCAWNLAIVD